MIKIKMLAATALAVGLLFGTQSAQAHCDSVEGPVAKAAQMAEQFDLPCQVLVESRMACGVGAYWVAIFHLYTHAFFKALLFLGSGSVIHALSGEQDMRKMGGLKDKIPVTFRTMFVASLAIAGIPGLAGFFSKDEILWQVFSSPLGSKSVYVVGIVTAAMTAFYMWRLMFMTFYGASRADARTQEGAPDRSGEGFDVSCGIAYSEKPRLMYTQGSTPNEFGSGLLKESPFPARASSPTRNWKPPLPPWLPMVFPGRLRFSSSEQPLSLWERASYGWASIV